MTKKIGFIIGSLRKESWNRKVAMVVKTLFPEDYDVEILEISQLPLYNEDLDQEGSEDENFLAFREKLAEKDGVVFFTPEYNRSVSAAVKNALDVGSRGAKNFWSGKPVAVASASTGQSGAMSGSLTLQQSFSLLNIHPMGQPEVYLANVANYFDENGEMIADTRAFLQTFVDAYVKHMAIFE